MTIDEFKKALCETKEICANSISCSNCPIAINVLGTSICPMAYMDSELVPPFEWPLGLPDDTTIAKPAEADHLTLNDYQRMARRTAGNKQNYEKIEESLFGLSGEVGELCDHYKKHKHQGHEINYEHMAEEAGDVLWYLAEISDALGVTLEDIARRNIDKLLKRYPDGFDPERSINRDGEHEDQH